MLMRLLSISGSSASLLGLFFVFKPASSDFTVGEGFFLATGVLLTIVAVALEVQDYYSNRPRFYRGKREIRNYMYAWISGGGTVCIFSNDLSWVDDDEMITMLQQKAERSELRLVLPEMIPLAEQLQQFGAKVVAYPQLNYVPQTRFTIVNAGRLDAQVAVGRRLNGKHCIEEFGSGDHPVFSVANDLVEMITLYSQSRNTNSM